MTENVEFNLRHALLVQAFDDLREAMKKRLPWQPIPPGLEETIDAFGAYAEANPAKLAKIVTHHSLFRPFPN